MQGHTKEKCYKLHGYAIGYKSKSRVNNVVVEDGVNGNGEPLGENLNEVLKGLSSLQCQKLLSALSGHLTGCPTTTAENEDRSDESLGKGKGDQQDNWQG